MSGANWIRATALTVTLGACSRDSRPAAVEVLPEDTHTTEADTTETALEVDVDVVFGVEVDVVPDSAEPPLCECPELPPAPEPIDGYCAGKCRTDADCGSGYVCRQHHESHGALICLANDQSQWEPRPELNYYQRLDFACLVDADCGARDVCSRGRHVGYCVAACASDADCDYEGFPRHCIDQRCEEGRLGEPCGEGRVWKRRTERPTGTCISRCGFDEECPGAFCMPLD